MGQHVIGILQEALRQILISEVWALGLVDMVDHGLQSVGSQFELHLANAMQVDVDSSLYLYVEEILLPEDGLLCEPLPQLLLQDIEVVGVVL